MTSLVLVTSDNATRRAFAAAAAASLPPMQLRECERLDAMPALLGELAGAAVAVDISPQPHAMIRSLATLAPRLPQARIVVVASDAQSDLVVEAMRAGARDFITRANLADAAELARRLAGMTSSQGRGHAVAVFSAAGGCGASTLAVNLANELALASGQPSLLADMDWRFGSLAAYLNVEGGYSVADVLQDASRLDADLVKSTAVTVSPRLHVLLSPAARTPLRAPAFGPELIPGAVDACRQAFAQTVVDAPGLPLPVTCALARAADRCILVIQRSVKDVRAARLLLAAMEHQDIAPDHVRIVANRCSRHGEMLHSREVADVLGRRDIAELDSDFAAAMRSLSMGKPLADAAPRSRLRRQIAELALTLAPSAAAAAA